MHESDATMEHKMSAQGTAKILFITANRLGDAVLSTGVLHHIIEARPDAGITVACGRLPMPIFAATPRVEHRIVLQKQNYHKHWWQLWQQVVGTRWDMVVDLRNSVVSRAIRARKRHILTSRGHDRHTQGVTAPPTLHKVAEYAHVIGLASPPAPRLWLGDQHYRDASKIFARRHQGDPRKVILAIGPTANWIGKMWPAHNFVDLVQRLTAPAGVLPHARVAVFAAPGEEESARPVLAALPEQQRMDMVGHKDLAYVLAVLARCHLYIGNDSGLMHCAAAAGIPTLGLFGPSCEEIYAPWGKRCSFVRTEESFAQLTGYPGYDPKAVDRSLMTGLSVARVLAGAAKVLSL